MISALLAALSLAGAADFYRDYAELSKAEREGVDYRVVVKNRRSAVAVLAIHGGDIELATSDVAAELARDDLSLYLFEGIKPRGNARLHLTSVNFDEPRALELARGARACVSIHGYRETARSVVCVGGASAKLRERMTQGLTVLGREQSFEVESPCVRFQGDRPENIVNRCQGPGVQLELSTRFRQRFDEEPALRRALGEAVRKAMLTE